MIRTAENDRETRGARAGSSRVRIPSDLQSAYADVYTPEVQTALAAMARFNRDQKDLMAARIQRRARRLRDQECIRFLDADSFIPRTQIKV